MLASDPAARTSAVVPSALRQPETVPSSLTNRNKSALNDAAALLLNTWPVGLPAPGIETVRPSLVVAWVSGLTLYSADTPVPLAEIQNGPVGLNDRPQPLTRAASVICAALTD